MFHPARLKSAIVASCRLPLGMPRRSLAAFFSAMGGPRVQRRARCVERNGAREATHSAFVAHQAVSFDLDAEEQRIVVAVGGSGEDAQAIAAGFALHPELLARPAPEGNEAALERFSVAGCIQKAQ